MNKIPELNLTHRGIEEIIFGTIKSRLLTAAVDLRVFDVLDTPKSAEETAAVLGTHPGNTCHLLRALTACGLIHRTGGTFVNSPEAKAFLDTKSRASIGQWLTQMSRTFEPILDNLTDLITDGPPTGDPEAHMNSETMCELYTHAHAQTELAGVARRTAALVKALPEYERFERMLDMGGGPGLNSVAIVQDHPVLKSVVFDRKSVTDIARGYIDRFGMTARIETRTGDYTKDNLGIGYDFILASDTLYYAPDELDAIVSRIFDALNPGGVLMAIHGVLTDDRTAPEKMVLGMLPDALMGQGELPDSGFLAPFLLRAGFASVHTREVPMVSCPMEVDVARKRAD
jgi:predicted O-methyltransferase YrrM